MLSLYSAKLSSSGRGLGVADSEVSFPPWPARDGYAVLVRAASAGIAITFACAAIRELGGPGIGVAWRTLFASLPMLWLTHRSLLAPHGLGFGRAFGLSRECLGGRRLASITLTIVALDQVGCIALSACARALGWEVAGFEAIDEEIVLGTRSLALLSAFDGVVWAPILEEIGFRGLLYATLRTRLGVFPSALASAALFGAVHLAPPAGFALLFWSGIVWAYA